MIENRGILNAPGDTLFGWTGGGRPTLNNYGTLNLTNGWATVVFPGNFQQFPSGVLNLDLAGRNVGTNFSRFVGVNTATLAGGLNVNLVNNYRPSLGDQFEILKFASRAGTLTPYSCTLPLVSPRYSATNVVLFAAAPTLTLEPTNQSVISGTNVMFTVQAEGTTPLTYQWQFNDTPLLNATNTSLLLTNVQAKDEGTYAVGISNAWASVTSAPAYLAVYVRPTILLQPTSVQTVLGSNAIFSVGATGTHLCYQWQFNNTSLAAETNTSLLLANVQTNQAGSYRVVVTNAAGALTSAVASLSIVVPPLLTSQPRSAGVVEGSDVSFTVGATGTMPMTYFWRYNGLPLTTTTTNRLDLRAVQISQAGRYSVLVSNLAGSTLSDEATLVVGVPPRILAQPQPQRALTGESVSFAAIVSGDTPLTYQWQLNGLAVQGATDVTLVLTNVQTSQSGIYALTASNAWGSAVSLPAGLTVIDPIHITNQLVAYFPFDGDFQDASGHANHGSPVGHPHIVPGFLGSGALNPYSTSNANHYVTLGTKPDLAFGTNTDFSISFWVRLPSGAWGGDPSLSDPVFIGNKDWSSGSSLGWVLATGSDGRLQWNYREASPNVRVDYDGPDKTFGNPTWHHVAVTFHRGGNAKTYVDGVLVDSRLSPETSTSLDTGLPLNIGNDGTGNYPISYGCWNNPDGDATAGLRLDDLGIWRRTLTAEEANALYHAGQAGRDLAAVTAADVVGDVPPQITRQPVGQEVVAGATVNFRVAATGTAPLSYYWRKNGVLI